MSKMFEIPIYAMDKRTLRLRVEKKVQAFIQNNNENWSLLSETSRNTIIRHIAPGRVYEYNHIVGFITVRYSQKEIYVDLYLPDREITRYHWASHRKVFLRNVMINGLHCYISGKTGKEVKKWIDDTIDSIHDYFPSQYYIDREAYDEVSSIVDFDKICNNKE